MILTIFQIKHFLADFPLQTPYMLRKFRPGWDFLPPLIIHCLVHAIMTLAVVWWYSSQLWWLALVDFVAHFIMDRIKSGPKYLGRYTDISKATYWVALGFDQMIHHITSVYIIWEMIRALGLKG